MWKLKSKLKRKFRSSKIDCNSNRVDFDTPSFDSDSAALPESEQSDTSAVAVRGSRYHGGGRRADVTGSASSENSSTLNYSCCYNYNFHINYNVHQRLHEHRGPPSGHNHHPHHPHHHHHHHHHEHHAPHNDSKDRTASLQEDTDTGTPYGSTSCMTESSVEPARRKRLASGPRKVRPMSSDRALRHSAGSSASSTKVCSEPGAGRKPISSGGKTATRCLSTSDLSSYKAPRERRRRAECGVGEEEEEGGEGPTRRSAVRPRSASQRRPVEVGHSEGAPSGDYLTLCRKLHAVSLQKEPTPTDLTDHDRRILHCMVLKRIKDLEQLEEAVLAQQCWEQEKVFRKSLLDQQERNYRKAIRQKRTIEMMEVRNRKQRLARLEQQQIEKIQNEISEKDIRSASLLKNIEIKKGIRECERRSRELKRLEDATVNHEEKVLDRDIWRQSLVETLEERASRADGLRRRVMDVYRRRLRIDNQLEQKMHAHNLQQTVEQERYKLSQLKERILVRESRFQKFKDSKKRIFDQLKNRAKTTAALRDMVKHSIGPQGSAGPGTGRPNSVLQHQRCGSSARSMATVSGSLGGIQPHRLLDVVPN